jgi:Domain of unknown function (DUF6285)
MNDDRIRLAGFLAAAETLLRDKAMVGSTGDARFAGLMVASALSMAQREIALAPSLAAARRELAEFAPQPSPFADPETTLVHLLREGLLDGQDELFARLLRDAVIRTAVTRPQKLNDVERRMANLE